jgi:predicted TIM-barrel fold metal-dependent hydrolase
MIVDAHAHVFKRLCGITGSGATEPLSYGKARLGTGQVLRFLPPLAVDTSFPAEVLLEFMDWVGVDKAVLLQGPLYGDMNTYVHSVVHQWPDRFIGAALLNPMSAFARAVFDHLVDELGFRVIKLELTEETGLCGIHTDLKLGDDKLRWFWEALNNRGLTVTLDLGPIGARSYQTREVQRLVEPYPNARWVMAHLAHPSPEIRLCSDIDAAWREQVGLARYPNVWLDLASLPYYFRDKEDYPYPSVSHFVCTAVELVGAEKLLWGTDVPGMLTMLTYQQMLDLFACHCDCLSQSEKDLIFGANALVAYG